MNLPKRHHYLPRFYLKGFCRNGKLSVFDRETSNFRKQTPKNIALQNHYYSSEDQNGEKNTDIETGLAKLEGCAGNILSKIGSSEQISREEKEILSLFVAFMRYRVPDFETSFNEMFSHFTRFQMDCVFSDPNHVKSILEQSGIDKSTQFSPNELVDFYRNTELKITIHKNERLRSMLNLSMRNADYFTQMDWLILHCPERTSFITTDNPVVLAPAQDYKPGFWGVGIVTKGAKKLFPLSQRSCLVMLDQGERITHINIDQQTVRSINLFMTSHSKQFVIARDETLVKNLVHAAKLTEFKRQGRFSFS